MTEGLNEQPQNKWMDAHGSSRIFLVAIAANLAVQLAFALIMLPFTEGMNAQTQTAWSFTGTFFIQAAYLFVYFRFVKHKNLSIQYHPRNKISPVSAFFSAGAGLCLLGMLFLPTVLVDNLLRLTGYTPMPLVLSSANIAVCIVAVVIVAPMFEELMFRGVLLSGFVRGGVWKGILFAALAFMLSHFNPAQTFYQFFVGILCGYVVVASGSLWAGVITHMMSNLAALLLELTPAGTALGSLTGYLTEHPAAFAGVTVGALCMFGALLLLVLYGLKRVSRDKEPTSKENGRTAEPRFAGIYYWSGCGIAVFMWLANYLAVVFG